MVRHLVFFAISLVAGVILWLWGFPALWNANNFFTGLLKNLFIFCKEFLPFSNNIFFLFLSFFCVLVLFFIFEIIDISTNEKKLTSRGSAKWATKKDVEDLKVSKGVPIGKFDGKILRTQNHLVTCAATRSGKGTGAIIPTLLEYPESIICLDIKGENYAVTGRRRKELTECFLINPFNIGGFGTNSFNWLDTIKLDDKNCGEKALQLASQLIGVQENNSTENHFNEQAKRLIQGVILFVCTLKDDNRNICTVGDLLHKTPINDLCKSMQKNNDAFGIISSVGSQFLNNSNDKEISGILSTAQRATNFLDNPNIKETLIKSDFDISKIADKKMSIYLIIPQDQVSNFQAYIRIFFDLAFSSLVARKERGQFNVLFLLDEVAQLGYMKSLASQISFVRGVGGQLWFFFQSYAQLQNIYGKDADNILSNSTQIFYGCNDVPTSELISKMLGNETILEYDKKGNSHAIAKPLLSADEVRQLPTKTPIIFIPGKPPIKVKRMDYFKEKEYKGLFEDNPYFGEKKMNQEDYQSREDFIMKIEDDFYKCTIATRHSQNFPPSYVCILYRVLNKNKDNIKNPLDDFNFYSKIKKALLNTNFPPSVLDRLQEKIKLNDFRFYLYDPDKLINNKDMFFYIKNFFVKIESALSLDNDLKYTLSDYKEFNEENGIKEDQIKFISEINLEEIKN